MKIFLRVGNTAREGWGQWREDGNVRDAGGGAFSQRHKLEDARRPRLHGGETRSLSTSREKGDTMRLGRAEGRRSWGPRDNKVPMRYRKQQLLFLVSTGRSGLQCGLHIPSPLLSAHPFISWHPNYLQLGEMNSTPVSCGMAHHFLYLCTASKWLFPMPFSARMHSGTCCLFMFSFTGTLNRRSSWPYDSFMQMALYTAVRARAECWLPFCASCRVQRLEILFCEPAGSL